MALISYAYFHALDNTYAYAHNMRMNIKNTSTDSNRRVGAARDGAGLPGSWHVAAAGDRFPPGGPRRSRYSGDPAMGTLDIGPGGSR
jgi:hypothetical protein